MGLRDLFGKKDDTPAPVYERRSGTERRTTDRPASPDRREIPDRRELLRDTEKIVQQYSKIPLFKGLSTEQIMKMLRICAKKKFPASHTIYKAGQASDDMLILLKGTMSVILSIGEAWTVVKPPGTVGEMGIFTGAPRSVDVISETDCVALKISKAELFHVFASDTDLHTKMLLNVIADLSDKLRHDHDEIVNLHYRLRALDQI